jgi:hypothetical protein
LVRSQGVQAMGTDGPAGFVVFEDSLARADMRPSVSRRCPLSTTAGTPSTGWQSRWSSGRWHQGCTPYADPATERRKPCLCQGCAASARARRPFGDRSPIPNCKATRAVCGWMRASSAGEQNDRMLDQSSPGVVSARSSRESGQHPGDPFEARDRQCRQWYLPDEDTPAGSARRLASPSTVKPWLAPAATSTAS